MSNTGCQVLPPSSERVAVSRTPLPCRYHTPRSSEGLPSRVSCAPVNTMRSPCMPPSISSNSPRLFIQLWCQTLRALSYFLVWRGIHHRPALLTT